MFDVRRPGSAYSNNHRTSIPEHSDKAMTTEKRHSETDAPKTFLSYAWESEQHGTWVRSLAEHLLTNRVPTLLDHWDLRPGMDFLRYMETSVRDSAFVVLACAPAFAQ